MAQADSQSTTRDPFLCTPEMHLAADPVASLTTPPTPRVAAVSGGEAADPIFDAMEAHKRELERRNQIIEALSTAEDRHKALERDAWHRYEAASIALLTTKPTSLAGLIALMNYVALPECSGPGTCETILNGATLSSNSEAAAAADHFPALSAEALRVITGKR